jgi:hypothetical protein
VAFTQFVFPRIHEIITPINEILRLNFLDKNENLNKIDTVHLWTMFII